MDHVDHYRSRIALDAVSFRIRELSERLAKRIRLAIPGAWNSRILKGSAFALLAISFGTIAFRLNREETELQWRRSHIPSPAIWKESFATAGFHALTASAQVARVTRRLPTLADVSGQIWKASPDWWAIDPSDGSNPLVFCLLCDWKKAPLSWMPAGSGWEGWEAALKEARTEAVRLHSTAHPKKRGESFDPREIRY